MSTVKKHPYIKAAKDELDLEESITYLIYRITNALVHNFRRDLGPTKIPIQEWRVLSSLKSRGGQSTISELSTCTIIKQPVISRIITEMQENGLVQKSQNKDDQRITEVKLSNKGNKLFESILPVAIQHREHALANINRKDIVQLRNTLKQIQYNLGIKPIKSRYDK